MLDRTNNIVHFVQHYHQIHSTWNASFHYRTRRDTIFDEHMASMLQHEYITSIFPK